MSLWLLIVVLLGLVKLPVAALMLWMPFRNDEAMRAPGLPEPSDEDGGSRALPGGPLDRHPRSPSSDGRHPRRPRRGPHGSPPPPSPRRVRTPVRSTRRVNASR